MMQRIAETRWIRALSLFRQRGWAYAAGVAVWGITLAFCFNIVMAFVFKDVLDASLAGDFSLLLRGVLLSLATFVFGLPLALAGRYAYTLSFLRTLTAIRMRLFSAVSRLPMHRLEERHSGDLVSRSTNDVRQFGMMLVGTMSGFAQAVAQGTIGMAAIFALEWRLGFIALAVGLCSFAVSTRFAKTLRGRSDAMQASMSTMTERLSDLLSGVQVTRMFRLEDEIQDRFASAANLAARQSIAHARTQARFNATQWFIGWFQTFGTLALGLLLFSHGHLLAGAVWAIVHIQGNTSFLFNFFGQFVTKTQRGLACGARVREVLDLPVESEPKAGPMPLLEASVELANVAFTYPENESRPALQGITLSARAHSVVAIVGPSGSGKSTLLKLLQGFYLPDTGCLRIGGIPLSGETLHDVRRSIAYVPQDAYLFAGTIRENIAYGKPDAPESDIIAAARAANAHDFILEQPDGYETPVGEGGASLSGGQRQRVAIARALLRDAPVLLLDEATSALDSESERLVQDALDSVMKGRTTLAVAHRLSTIRHADVIYVLDDGRIVEQGSHEELLAAGRLYRHLYELQFKDHMTNP